MSFSFPHRRLRIVGDVHGDIQGFTAACTTDRFIIQLGDLTDGGTDNAATLELMVKLLQERRGLFVLGNHDYKLCRVIRGDLVARNHALLSTLAVLSPTLCAETQQAIENAPVWLRIDNLLFVHGGFHTAMLDNRSPADSTHARPDARVARALYGETTGRTQSDGYPERTYRWVDRVPAGITVYCGHSTRSVDGQPLVCNNPEGGRVVFMDTGAGKGGHLSWIDLDIPEK